MTHHCKGQMITHKLAEIPEVPTNRRERRAVKAEAKAAATSRARAQR